MAQGVFITGTDTGVGKTTVSAALLTSLRRQGVDATPMKPVQTGCSVRAGRLVAPDIEYCLAAAGLTPGVAERHDMAPYCFRPACSPHRAAQLAHSVISLKRIMAGFDALAKRHDFVVVEGAGGVMVPLSRSMTMLDLMLRMALPVVLVARPGLGTLNHTFLSLQALRQAGLRVAGVIINASAPGGLGDLEQDNLRTIAGMGHIRILAVVPFFRALPDVPEHLARFAARVLPPASEILAWLNAAG